MKKRPHRQICGLCHRVLKLDFVVPKEIWESTVHRSQLHTIHCFECFTERADESLIEWDKDIKFIPYSMASQLEITLNQKNWTETTKV